MTCDSESFEWIGISSFERSPVLSGLNPHVSVIGTSSGVGVFVMLIGMPYEKVDQESNV